MPSYFDSMLFSPFFMVEVYHQMKKTIENDEHNPKND